MYFSVIATFVLQYYGFLPIFLTSLRQLYIIIVTYMQVPYMNTFA